MRVVFGGVSTSYRCTSPIAFVQLFARECGELKRHKLKFDVYLYNDQFVKVA